MPECLTHKSRADLAVSVLEQIESNLEQSVDDAREVPEILYLIRKTLETTGRTYKHWVKA